MPAAWKRMVTATGYLWRHTSGWEVQRVGDGREERAWVGVSPSGEELRPAGFYGRWAYRTADTAMRAVEAHLIRLGKQGA